MGNSRLTPRRGDFAFAIFAAWFALHAFSASATEVDRSFNQRFEVAAGARLELEHDDGDVVITPWDQDAIEVDVRYRVEYRRVGIGRDPDLDVSFDQRGDVVRVIGKEAAAGGVGFFSSNEIEYVYRVSAPSWVVLDLLGDDGDVEIEGWRGTITLRNDDGDVYLKDLRLPRLRLEVEDGDVEVAGVEGEIDIEVEDGDVTVRDCQGRRIRIEGEDGRIRLEDCQGNFDLSTTDGDVDLSGLRAGKLEVRTDDGRIEIDVDSGPEPLELVVSAEDGDIDLKLGTGVTGAFALSTDDGDLRVEAEASELSEERHRVSGRLGDGEGNIQVSTNSGRITLRR